MTNVAWDMECESAATLQADSTFAIWPKRKTLGSDEAKETGRDKNA